MSLRALSTRAVWRDSAVPADETSGEPIGGGEPEAGAAELQKAKGALTDAIPTEVLGPYTAIVAIIVANTSAVDTRAALRWWTYGVSLAFILVYVIASFLGDPTKKRRLPWAEMFAALFAFAAWGLAMPGSPLTISVHTSDFAIASAMIAVGGAVVLGLFSVPMNAKSSKAPH